MTLIQQKPQRTDAPRRPLLAGVLGLGIVMAVWWIAAETIFAGVGVTPQGTGGSIPNPYEVVMALVEGGFGYFGRHLSVTITEALIGFAWGVGIALALASLVVVFPRLERSVMQVAIISYCIPIVAIGPIVRIISGAPAPGEPSGTAVFLGAMLVIFTTLIGSLLGLRAADRASLELVSVYGGGRFKQFVKVRAIAALPGILNALKIAMPLAFLGAIIGEYLGGVDVGIGPALVNAQQGLLAPRAWALAVVTGAVSGIGFAIIAVLSRLVTPWTRGETGAKS
ncbi:ABC transporter permease [Ruicaihuangia caeni]|uniref:ABC transporter permease subunit n=1 Tax=Ruicaihuangia caeni TaxID=3042517 RepID=A0AAW6TC04_9MICO|nr:ABC transporter permease subunit [Klugiella sp. YN-L-19]MDI2099132.1 ABC transporter permease subunit [Klugiella sp. YN-L-19]